MIVRYHADYPVRFVITVHPHLRHLLFRPAYPVLCQTVAAVPCVPLFCRYAPDAVTLFRRAPVAHPPRYVILRLPPHITLTPVNLTVQVVALVFRQLKNMLSVAQLRFQQVTAAVVKVFNPPPVRQRGGQQVAQRVIFMFVLSGAVLFGNQQATTVIL